MPPKTKHRNEFLRHEEPSIAYLHHLPILSYVLVVHVLIFLLESQAHLQQLTAQLQHPLDARLDGFTAHRRDIDVHVVRVIHVL